MIVRSVETSPKSKAFRDVEEPSVLHTELTEGEIKKFYTDNLPVVPHHPHQRHYRLKLMDGSFVKVPRIIRDSIQLRSYLIRYKPIAVYATVSRWMRPNKLGGRQPKKKGDYRWANNIFLGSDFVLDFDRQHSDTENINNAIQFLLTKTRYSFTVVKTGNGYHIHVTDFDVQHPLIEKPQERERYCLSEMKRFSKELQEHGIKFDVPVSEDTRRLIRVWGTLHRNGTTIRRICSFRYDFNRRYPIKSVHDTDEDTLFSFTHTHPFTTRKGGHL